MIQNHGISNNHDAVKNYALSVYNVRLVCWWRFPLQLGVLLANCISVNDQVKISNTWSYCVFLSIFSQYTYYRDHETEDVDIKQWVLTDHLIIICSGKSTRIVYQYSQYRRCRIEYAVTLDLSLMIRVSSVFTCVCVCLSVDFFRI